MCVHERKNGSRFCFCTFPHRMLMNSLVNVHNFHASVYGWMGGGGERERDFLHLENWVSHVPAPFLAVTAAFLLFQNCHKTLHFFFHIPSASCSLTNGVLSVLNPPSHPVPGARFSKLPITFRAQKLYKVHNIPK